MTAGAQSVFVSSYKQNGAIAFAVGPVTGFRGLIANGDFIYDPSLAGIQVVGGFTWVESRNIGFVYTPAPPGGTRGSRQVYAYVLRASEANDLEVLVPGLEIVLIGGFTSYGSYFIPGVGTGPVPASYWGQILKVNRVQDDEVELVSTDPLNPLYQITTAPVLDTTTFGIRSSGTQPYVDTAKVSDLAFYEGQHVDDQSAPRRNTADPRIVAEEGASIVPDYAGIVYAVAYDLDRNQFGNTFPASVDAIFNNGTVSRRNLLSGIFQRGNVPSWSYDTSKVGGEEVLGYSILGVQVGAQSIQPLQMAYDIVTQQDGRRIKYLERKNADVVVIPEEDLAAFAPGEAVPSKAQFTREPDTKLPSSVEVSFLDFNRDLEASSVCINWHVGGDNHNVSPSQVDLGNITMTEEEAKQIGWRILRNAHSNATRGAVTLPPKYAQLAENDIIQFPFAGKTRRLLLQRVDNGENGLIRCEGLEELVDQDLIDVPVGALGEGARLPLPAPVSMVLEDLPPIRQGDELRPGVYCGVHDFVGSRFPGASLFEAMEDGSGSPSYTASLSRGSEDVVGICDTVLASGPVGFVDNASTVDVRLFSGELESVTLDVLLQTGTYAMVGTEVIKFTTATLVSGDTYRLSGLLRGLRGTESQVDAHAVGDPFLLFTKSSGFQVPFEPASMVGRYYKVGAPGAAVADLSQFYVKTQLKTLRPFCPMAGTTTGSLGSDVAVTWRPRTRALAPTFSELAVPGEPVAYRVQVEWTASGSETPAGVYEATTEDATFTLTSVLQSSLEIDPADSVDILVSQLGIMSTESEILRMAI